MIMTSRLLYLLVGTCFCFFSSKAQTNYTTLTAGDTSPLNFSNSQFALTNTRESFNIDYDNDGDQDIITINSTLNNWHLIRNNGSGSFVEETGTTINLSIVDVEHFIVFDYDNDGDQDILDPTKGSENQAAIFVNNGGTFTELTAGGTSPLNFTNTNFAYGGPFRVCFTMDYDTDGDEDIIAINTNINAWHLIRNNGSGVFTEETSTTVSLSINNPVNFFTIDYDNDGDTDIIDPITGTENQATILRNDNGTYVELSAGNSSPFDFPNTHLSVGNYRESFAIDFDVDGDQDIIAINSAHTAWHLLRNNGSGVFTEETSTTIDLSIQNAVNFLVLDYDNDDDDDIIDPTAGDNHNATILMNNEAPPKLATSIPNNGAIDFPANENLELTFNEAIAIGTGNIEIRQVSNHNVITTIPVASTQISGSVLTIDPTDNLPVGIPLYVHIDAGAIVDMDNEIAVSLVNNKSTLSFTATTETLGIKNQTEYSFSVFPNPTSDVLNIKSNSGIDSVTITILSSYGQEILKTNNKKINLSRLSSGVYYVKINTSNQQSEIFKILKQ